MHELPPLVPVARIYRGSHCRKVELFVRVRSHCQLPGTLVRARQVHPTPARTGWTAPAPEAVETRVSRIVETAGRVIGQLASAYSETPLVDHRNAGTQAPVTCVAGKDA